MTRATTTRVARWTWIVVLVGGIVLFELVRRTLVATENPNFLPSLSKLRPSPRPHDRTGGP